MLVPLYGKSAGACDKAVLIKNLYPNKNIICGNMYERFISQDNSLLETLISIGHNVVAGNE